MFLLTVIGAGIARARGWVPEGKFTLGRWGWPVIIVGGVYLLVMFIDMVAPTGLSSPRGALFNLDWITLVVMVIVFIVGWILFSLRAVAGSSTSTCATTRKSRPPCGTGAHRRSPPSGAARRLPVAQARLSDGESAASVRENLDFELSSCCYPLIDRAEWPRGPERC